MLYVTFALIIIIYCLLYYYGTKNYDYWRKRGVPYVQPTPFVGNLKDLLLLKTSVCEWIDKICKENKGQPFFGVWFLNNPTLVILDVELLKKVLIKDFSYFSNRGSYQAPLVEPVTEGLMFVRVPDWKPMRSKLIKYMSPSQVRRSFDLINELVGEFKNHLRKLSGDNKPLSMQQLSKLNTTEIFSSVFFGLEAKCYASKISPFGLVTQKMLKNTIVGTLRQFCYLIAPVFIDNFKVRFLQKDIWDELKEYVTFSINERIKSGVRRGDFIDTLIELKNIKTDSGDQLFYENRIIAQPTVFLIAGLLASSSSLSFLLHELSLNKDIQEKLRKEITTTLNKFGGCTYEAILTMRYLHATFCETVRKYPGLPFSDRICLEDYAIPGTDVVIERGTKIIVPIFPIHHDPEIYPEPKKFDPDRFLGQNKYLLDNMSYLPFGMGQRYCVGKNYAEVILKTTIVHILSEFEVEKCDETCDEIKYQTKSFFLEFSNGAPMYLRRLDNPYPI